MFIRVIFFYLLIHHVTSQTNRFRQVNTWVNQRSSPGIQQNLINSGQSGQLIRSSSGQGRFTQRNTITLQQRPQTSGSNQLQRSAQTQQRREFRPGISSLPGNTARNALSSSTERRLSQQRPRHNQRTQSARNTVAQRSGVQGNRNQQQTLPRRSNRGSHQNVRTSSQRDGQFFQTRNSKNQQRSQNSNRPQSRRNVVTSNIQTTNRRMLVKNISPTQSGNTLSGNSILIPQTNSGRQKVGTNQGQNKRVTQRNRNSITNRRPQIATNDIVQGNRLLSLNNQRPREQIHNRANMLVQTQRITEIGQKISTQNLTPRDIGSGSGNNIISRDSVNNNAFESFDPAIFDRVAMTRTVIRNSTNGDTGFRRLEVSDLLGDVSVVESSNIQTHPKVHFVSNNNDNNNPGSIIQNEVNRRTKMPSSSGSEKGTEINFNEPNVGQNSGIDNEFSSINFQEGTETNLVNEPLTMTFRAPNPIVPHTRNIRQDISNGLAEQIPSNNFELQQSSEAARPAGRISSDSQRPVVDTFTRQTRPQIRGRGVVNSASSQNSRRNQISRSNGISRVRSTGVSSRERNEVKNTGTSSLDSEYNNHISYKVRALLNGENIDMTLPQQLQERITQRELQERTAQRTELRTSPRQSVPRSQIQPRESIQPSVVRTPIQPNLASSISSNDRSRGTSVNGLENTGSQSTAPRRTPQTISNVDSTQNSLNEMSPWNDVLTGLDDNRIQIFDQNRPNSRQGTDLSNLIERAPGRPRQRLDNSNTGEENWWNGVDGRENKEFQIDQSSTKNSISRNTLESQRNGLDRQPPLSDLSGAALSPSFWSDNNENRRSRIEQPRNNWESNSAIERKSRTGDISNISPSPASENLSRLNSQSRDTVDQPIRDLQMSEFREFRPPPPPELGRGLSTDRRTLDRNPSARISELGREEPRSNSRERIGIFSDPSQSERVQSDLNSRQNTGEGSARREGFDLDKFLQTLSSTSGESTDSTGSSSISNRRSSTGARDSTRRFSAQSLLNRRPESSRRSESNDLFSGRHDNLPRLDIERSDRRDTSSSEGQQSRTDTLPDWAWNDISSPSRTSRSRPDMTSGSRRRERTDNLLNSVFPSEITARRPDRRRIENRSERRNSMSRFTMSGNPADSIQSEGGDFNLTAFLETLSRDADSRDRSDPFEASLSNGRGDQQMPQEPYDPWKKKDSSIATGGRFFDMPSNGPRNDIRTRGRGSSRGSERPREERRLRTDLPPFENSNDLRRFDRDDKRLASRGSDRMGHRDSRNNSRTFGNSDSNRLSDRLSTREDNRLRPRDRDRRRDRDNRSNNRSFRQSRANAIDRNVRDFITTTEAPWFDRRTTPRSSRFEPDITTQRFQQSARNARNERRNKTPPNVNRQFENPLFDSPTRSSSSSEMRETGGQDQSSSDNTDFDLRSFLASLDKTDAPSTTTTSTTTSRPTPRSILRSKPEVDPSLRLNLNALSIDNTAPFNGLPGINTQQNRNSGSEQPVSSGQETGDSSFLTNLLGLESSGSILPMGSNIINDVPQLQEGNDNDVLKSVPSIGRDTTGTGNSISRSSVSTASSSNPISTSSSQSSNRNNANNRNTNTGSANSREIRISLDGSQSQNKGQSQNPAVIVLQIRSDGTVVNGSTADNQRHAYEVTPQVTLRTTPPLTTTKSTTTEQTTTTTTTQIPKTTTDDVSGLRAQLDRQNTLLHNILRSVGNKETSSSDQASQLPVQQTNQVPSLEDIKRQHSLRDKQTRQHVGGRVPNVRHGNQRRRNEIRTQQGIAESIPDISNAHNTRDIPNIPVVHRDSERQVSNSSNNIDYNIINHDSTSAEISGTGKINLEPEIAALKAAFDAALFDKLAMSRSMPSERERRTDALMAENRNRNSRQPFNNRQDVTSVDSAVQWLGNSRPRERIPLRRETFAGPVERERIGGGFSSESQRANEIPNIEKKIGNFESIIRSLELPTTASSDSKVTPSSDPLTTSVFNAGLASDDLKLAVRNLLEKVGREKTISILKDVAATSLDTQFESSIRREIKQENKPETNNNLIKNKRVHTENKRIQRKHRKAPRKSRRISTRKRDDFKLLGNILQTAIRVEPVPTRQTTTKAPAMVTSRSAHLGLLGNSGSILDRILRNGATGPTQEKPIISREEMTLRALDVPTLQGRFMPFVPGRFRPNQPRKKDKLERNNPRFRQVKRRRVQKVKEASPKYRTFTTTITAIPKTTTENKSDMNYLRQELKRLMGVFDKLGL